MCGTSCRTVNHIRRRIRTERLQLLQNEIGEYARVNAEALKFFVPDEEPVS
jgi:hypothetical protein